MAWIIRPHKVALLSPVGNVKIVSPISIFILKLIYIDNQIKCLFYHNAHKKFRVPWLESVTGMYVLFFVSGNNSTTQTWTVSNSQDKGRSALPRRRTGFNAGALIPGSVSTMVSIPESDDGRSSRSIASPSFQNLLDHDESSDYETDLEEDFPGTFVQCYD